MNFRPLQFIVTIGRKWPRLSSAAITICFLLLVPVWPYTPTCDLHPGKEINIEGSISPDYRTSLKMHFRDYDIYYWEIGGIILIRALPFLDGGENFAYNDAFLDANDKAALTLASKLQFRSYVGRELNGRIYRVPEFIEALRNPKTGKFDFGKCNFMVPVVTGKPVPESPSNNITN